MSKPRVLIDVSGYAHQAFHALPAERNKNGTPCSVLRAVGEIMKKKPHAIYCFDGDDSRGFRQNILPSYKANRPPVHEDLKVQLPLLQNLADKLGVKKMVATKGWEADDLIFDMARAGEACVIVSRDKDLIQAISDDPKDKNVQLYDSFKKIFKDANYCLSHFGVKPSQFLYFQSLVGDSADNIPGIPGIGPVAAQKIIEETGGDPNVLQDKWAWFADKFKKMKNEDAAVKWVASWQCVKLGVRK